MKLCNSILIAAASLACAVSANAARPGARSAPRPGTPSSNRYGNHDTGPLARFHTKWPPTFNDGPSAATHNTNAVSASGRRKECRENTNARKPAGTSTHQESPMSAKAAQPAANSRPFATIFHV